MRRSSFWAATHHLGHRGAAEVGAAPAISATEQGSQNLDLDIGLVPAFLMMGLSTTTLVGPTSGVRLSVDRGRSLQTSSWHGETAPLRPSCQM